MSRDRIQFGTEQFTAAISNRPDGVPDHAAMIEGRLIHLDTKNLKGWGVTAAAAKQILDAVKGVPVRACNSPDPHACDFSSDNFANVGYATHAHIENGWIVASAAITDREAAQKINDKTWMPFGSGGWSVTGFPSDPTPDFKTSGLTNGFAPASIALIIGNGTPAFEGSGFEMVAAAISNHRGDNNMTETIDGGGTPVTYTQEDLDAKIKDALAQQKTDDADALQKAADAEIAKQREASIEELAKQKADLEEKFGKLSGTEKAAYETKIAEMTSKDDMETILAAHGKKVQADTLDTLERQKLTTEYEGVVRGSPVAGAPFIQDGKFSQPLFDAEMQTIGGMQTAAIAGIVSKAKMVAAAVPGQNSFNTMEVPGTPPGSETSEAAELAICDRMR